MPYGTKYGMYKVSFIKVKKKKNFKCLYLETVCMNEVSAC